MEKIVRVWSLEIPSSYALQVILFHGVIELEDTVETISNSFSTCFSLLVSKLPNSKGFYLAGGGSLQAL